MLLAVGSSSTDRTAFPQQTSAGSTGTDLAGLHHHIQYLGPTASPSGLSEIVPPAWVLPVHHRARLGLSWGSGFSCRAPDKIRQRRSPAQTKPCQCNLRQPAAGSWSAWGFRQKLPFPCGIGRHTMHNGLCSDSDMVIWHSIAAGLMVLNRPGKSAARRRCTAKEVPSCSNTCLNAPREAALS